MGGKSRLWVGIAGLSLLAGFFLPWVDVGGAFRASGFDIVRGMDGQWPMFRFVMLVVPLLGAAMAFAAFSGSRYAKHLSIFTGLLVLGYGAYKTISAFIATSGWGLWLVIGAALVALIAPLFAKNGR
jgi:hypothetical protein